MSDKSSCLSERECNVHRGVIKRTTLNQEAVVQHGTQNRDQATRKPETIVTMTTDRLVTSGQALRSHKGGKFLRILSGAIRRGLEHEIQ